MTIISAKTPELGYRRQVAQEIILRFETPSQAVKLRPILPRCDLDGRMTQQGLEPSSGAKKPALLVVFTVSGCYSCGQGDDIVPKVEPYIRGMQAVQSE